MRISLTATVTSRARRARGDANREAHVVTRHRGHGRRGGVLLPPPFRSRIGGVSLLFGATVAGCQISSAFRGRCPRAEGGVAVAMAPPRHSPKRVQRRAQQLQERQREEAERRRSRQGDADKEPAARRSLDKDAPSFGKGDLPQVDLRDDPTTPDGEVTEISCYGGRLQSLSQIVGISRFANLRSLCVHGCRLTGMDVDPMLRACGDSLRDLNLSSNRLARLEGLPVLRNLRTLDVTNNAIVSLDGIDLSAQWPARRAIQPGPVAARAHHPAGRRPAVVARAPRHPRQQRGDVRGPRRGAGGGGDLRAILLRSSPSPFGSFEPSSDADDPECPPRRRRRPTRRSDRGFWGGRGRTAWVTPCAWSGHRLAVAAMAPWPGLDGNRYRGDPTDWRRDPARWRTPGTRICWSVPRARRRGGGDAALARSAAAGGASGKRRIRLSPAEESRRRSRPTTRPPRDESNDAEDGRGADPVQVQGDARAVGQVPRQAGSARVTFALTDEILRRWTTTGYPRRRRRVASQAEPDPPSPPRRGGTAAVRDETTTTTRREVERKRAKKRDRKERGGAAEAAEADAAVVDHELRLRRIGGTYSERRTRDARPGSAGARQCHRRERWFPRRRRSASAAARSPPAPQTPSGAGRSSRRRCPRSSRRSRRC